MQSMGTINPFAVASMPTLTALTNVQRWLRGIGEQVSERSLRQRGHHADPHLADETLSKESDVADNAA